jgi:hypothetical protein
MHGWPTRSSLGRLTMFFCSGNTPRQVIRLRTDSTVETEIVDVPGKETRRLPTKSSNTPSPRKRSYQLTLADDDSCVPSSPDQELFVQSKRGRASSDCSEQSTAESAPTSWLSDSELLNLKNGGRDRLIMPGLGGLSFSHLRHSSCLQLFVFLLSYTGEISTS